MPTVKTIQCNNRFCCCPEIFLLYRSLNHIVALVFPGMFFPDTQKRRPWNLNERLLVIVWFGGSCTVYFPLKMTLLSRVISATASSTLALPSYAFLMPALQVESNLSR